MDQMYFIDSLQQALFSDRVVGRTECYGTDHGVPCIWDGLACTQRSMSIRLAPSMEEGKAAVGMGRETNGETGSGEESRRGFECMKAAGRKSPGGPVVGDERRGQRKRQVGG